MGKSTEWETGSEKNGKDEGNKEVQEDTVTGEHERK